MRSDPKLVVFALLFGSLVLSGCSSKPARSDWETCSSDADCILVEGPCDVPRAIHKEAQPTFEEFVAQVEERNTCAVDGRAQWSEEIKPGCTNGKCTPVYMHKLMKKR